MPEPAPPSPAPAPVRPPTPDARLARALRVLEGRLAEIRRSGRTAPPRLPVRAG